MDAEPSMATIGALIGAPARAAILTILYDGRAMTATELAYASGVAAATASEHLAKLTQASLLVCETHGRHRYYKIASSTVADILEPLIHLTPSKPAPMRAPSKDFIALKDARLCYDHFAGSLGVMITDALINKNVLEADGRDFILTEPGSAFLVSMGVDVVAARSKRRIFARRCLDWSERRPHLAGALGAAIADTAFQQEWVIRTAKRRQVTITEKGIAVFKERLGIRLQ